MYNQYGGYSKPVIKPVEPTKPTFNYNDWEKVICTEKGEKAQCDQCKQIIEGNFEVGEHMFCENCHKYIWRLKTKQDGIKSGP